jgi:hypothetical protein
MVKSSRGLRWVGDEQGKMEGDQKPEAHMEK